MQVDFDEKYPNTYSCIANKQENALQIISVVILNSMKNKKKKKQTPPSRSPKANLIKTLIGFE